MSRVMSIQFNYYERKEYAVEVGCKTMTAGNKQA